MHRRAALFTLALALLALPALAVAQSNVSAKRPISAWGDSMTRGTGAKPGGSYPEQMAALSGRTVTGHGFSGASTGDILAKMREGGDLSASTVIIWAGRNDVAGNDPWRVVNGIEQMLELTDGEHYLVLAVTNGKSEPRGTAGYETIAAINRQLAEIHGDRFIDIRTSLVSSATADEIAALRDDVIPDSLLADDLHFNDEGYRLVANLVLGRLNRLGW